MAEARGLRLTLGFYDARQGLDGMGSILLHLPKAEAAAAAVLR